MRKKAAGASSLPSSENFSEVKAGACASAGAVTAPRRATTSRQEDKRSGRDMGQAPWTRSRRVMGRRTPARAHRAEVRERNRRNAAAKYRRAQSARQIALLILL